VYSSTYWKESCFGLTAETLVDKAVGLKYIGGTFAGNLQPTEFLCLLLKMLQLQPEEEIVNEFITNEDFKYLRILGCMYMRMVGKSEEIYKTLEPLYNDYRKVIFRSSQGTGWEVLHIDEFIDQLLNEELVCGVAMPFLQPRMKLEDLGLLPPRESALDEIIKQGGMTVFENQQNIQNSVQGAVVVFDDDSDD
jgi:pre-mRNA-splicing factor 38A